MEYKNFTDYIFTKMEKNDANMSIYALTEKGDIGFMLPNASFNLEIMRKKNMIAWSITGHQFEEKHRKAMVAFVNAHNDKPEEKHKLHIKGNKLICSDINEDIDDSKTIEILEGAVNWFTRDSEVINKIDRLLTSAKVRADIIKTRVDDLKTRACEYDNKGEHGKAKKCYFEVCQYYGYSHMELVALLYGNGKETNWGKFPVNKEYQLEYQMVAVEKDKENVFAPMVAYNMAKNLGKTELCERIVAIGQERGTWNTIALRSQHNPVELFKRIAECYRKGVGCEINEDYAKYYDRLAAGERQEVFKDMIRHGFKPVFELMCSRSYYEINSLDELSEVSEEFKNLFLYGEATAKFKLPEWFVPLVNGLNEEDRSTVLKKVKESIKKQSDSFLSDINLGKIEVVINWDNENGILLEADGNLSYVYLPNLEEVVKCQIVTEIKNIMAELKEKTQGENDYGDC